AEQGANLTASTSAAADASIDAQAAREQRAKAAIDTLASASADNNLSSNNLSGGNSNSAVPVAASTAAHNANLATGRTASSPSAETNLSQADRVRFVQRVEQAFQDLNSQGGSVRLRLSPPDLGSLRIEIKVTRGEMTARVEADTPSARNLLLDNLPALRDRL